METEEGKLSFGIGSVLGSELSFGLSFSDAAFSGSRAHDNTLVKFESDRG